MCHQKYALFVLTLRKQTLLMGVPPKVQDFITPDSISIFLLLNICIENTCYILLKPFRFSKIIIIIIIGY